MNVILKLIIIAICIIAYKASSELEWKHGDLYCYIRITLLVILFFLFAFFPAK